MNSFPRGLYAIADTGVVPIDRLADAVSEALLGGAVAIQFRDKSLDHQRRLNIARELAQRCRAAGAAFIVNDDIDLAAASAANGVHLGREDDALELARQRLGPSAIIGASCYNELARAMDAQARGANYAAFGRFFASRTKPGAVFATLDLLREAVRTLHVPVVAIGGITPDNGRTLVDAGAHSLAAIDGVFGGGDIKARARRYADLFPAIG